jgi:D-alanyl-D-alanine carboxypeptidase/D-alanyl-D-alanine-endopeptidase (penicillin-binding protein 4)
MNNDMAGRVYAKTGYIGGVRSLSGYIHTHDDRWVVFSIIYNDINGSVKPFEELQDAACRAVYESTVMERVIARVVDAR